MSAIGENRRIAVTVTTCLAALALAGVGCGGDADTVDPGSANAESALTLEDAQAPLKQGDPELVSLREDANEILDEGVDGFDARMAELEAAGIPVVVNKWASWCGPCREEFPDFQAQAIERESDVAFIGLLSNDGSDTGETFLAEFPTPYPSYLDPDQEIARDRGIDRAFPTTLFVDADGEVAFTKYGPYSSGDELAADIERYAQ
ncbi:MAG: TlpA family protein disulfide reductase [Actinomycetota bacterium]|nr:TlpA family protein disulfide reductase [Actinomycetota bacterium]